MKRTQRLPPALLLVAAPLLTLLSGCPHPPGTAACGNGAVDPGETCDGLDFGGETCAGRGFTGGTLACGSACAIDSSACTSDPGCGNGVIDAPEACDGADLGAATCASLGLGGGTLACSATCAYDAAGCAEPPVCGDGILGAGETCDGANLATQTCQTLGFDSGVLGCTSACAFETSGCALCGNSVLDAGEVCDGSVGGSDCISIAQGFVGGTLTCSGSCTFDTSACTVPAGCGDGLISGAEDCEGTDLAGTTCGYFGWGAGALACTAGCLFDQSGCYSCGDGVLDGPEVCDSSLFGGYTCATLGFSGGTLLCPPGCLSFDTSGCTASTCGNGVVESGEACDGAALGGMTCESFYLTSGTLGCTSACTLDRTACVGPDLIVYEAGLTIDLMLNSGYNPNVCEEALGCVGGTSGRDVLEFTLISENVGSAVLAFGNPTMTASWAAPYTGLWAFNTCGYRVFHDYAIYWMCSGTDLASCESGVSAHVAEGFKESFCFIENFGAAPDWTGAPAICGTYGCSNMGQKPGCADDYYPTLDCQLIDVTPLAGGTYVLCAHLDPTNAIYELRDDNNIGCALVSF